MKKTARCACGSLKAEVDGEPVRISVCHCIECQRRTGSAFGAQARFASDDVRIEGAATTYARQGESGQTITFHFCPRCGATVYYTLERLPGFVAVALGAFGDPTFPPPSVSVYEARKHAWVGLPESIEHMD